MKIIALEEHFVLPREEQSLPPGAHRGNDRERVLGFDVVAALLDLGDARIAATQPVAAVAQEAAAEAVALAESAVAGGVAQRRSGLLAGPIGDIATFAISGKGLAYSYPSPLDHTPRGGTGMKLPRRRRFLHLAAGAAALPGVSRIARAQTYPDRSVKIVVPVAPSGSYDIVGRPWRTSCRSGSARPSSWKIARRRNGRRDAGGHPITGGRLHAARRWLEQHRVQCRPLQQAAL